MDETYVLAELNRLSNVVYRQEKDLTLLRNQVDMLMQSNPLIYELHGNLVALAGITLGLNENQMFEFALNAYGKLRGLNNPLERYTKLIQYGYELRTRHGQI